KITYTNEQGWFSISELSGGTKQSVAFEKSGYLKTYKVVEITVGQSSFIDATLSTAPSAQSVSTSAGGTLTLNNGATVVFQQNAFTDLSGNAFNGTAMVTAKYFDPTSPTYNQVFPGNFTGQATSGTQGQLQSFGFIDATLKASSGTSLKLANGKTSTLTIPIPVSLQSQAPATIPLWYYDTTAAIWKEEGIANKVGNTYVGTVTHFTSWNWDRFYDVAYITGRVIDGSGNPIANAYVTADGVDYTGQSYKYTDSNGRFNIGVRMNSTVKVKASKDGTTSTPSNVSTPTASGQTKDIGDIILSPPIATITLTWGVSPRDVDSHLYIPVSGSEGPGHVYWSATGSANSYPYANLDTDDRDGYGPEVVTIFRKFTGTYKYMVHNYSGESSFPLANSGARVTLVIGGQLYTFTVPASNTNSYNTWRVFELVISSSGAVQITTVNDFKPSSEVLPKRASGKK
ncbi:MAG: carboxypeptidase regulatory-like domain-containing protein, partial [Melioribacteraceae bacterium]